MKLVNLITVLLISVLLNLYSTANSQTSYNFNDGLAKAKASGKIAVVAIFVQSDNWCKKMESVYSSGNVLNLLNNSLVFIKLDASGSENCNYGGKQYKASELAKVFGATGYPTHAFLGSDENLIKFKFNGETNSSYAGYVDSGDFEKLLNYFITGKYKDTDLSKYLQ